MIEFNRHPSRRDLRAFAVLQVVFFLVIAWSVYSRTQSLLWPGVIISLSLAVGVVGWFVEPFIRRVYLGWMWAVFPIGWLVTHTVLALVFYLLMTPIGCIMKWTGRDPLDRRFDSEATSYWQPRPPQTGSKRYFRQF